MKDEAKDETVQDLRQRTKAFAVRVIHLADSLPGTLVGRTLGAQVLRSGTSVGAHYRESCRSRSDAEMVSKLETALQELDETAYWLELLVEADVVPAKRLEPLQTETDELIAILVTIVKKVKARKKR